MDNYSYSKNRTNLTLNDEYKNDDLFEDCSKYIDHNSSKNDDVLNPIGFFIWVLLI